MEQLAFKKCVWKSMKRLLEMPGLEQIVSGAVKHGGGEGGGREGRREQNKGVLNEHQVRTLYKALIQAVLVQNLDGGFLKYEGHIKHHRIDQTSSQRCLLQNCFPVSLGK